MSLTVNMATRRQPPLSEVIQAHATNLTTARQNKAQIELEIRVPHNQYLPNDWLNIWRGAYNRILAQYQDWVSKDSKESWITSVECSVRMIDSSSSGNRILQAEYTGPNLTRRLGITKQNVISTLYNGFKVSLSKEIEGPPEQYEKIMPTLVRLRIRVSFQIPTLPDWRVDFTYVASTDVQSAFNSFLTDIRKSFLPKGTLTPANFMESVVEVPGASPELEIEWIRKDRPPTEAEIQNGVRHVRQIVWETQSEGNEYSMVIRWLAKLLDRNLKDRSTLKQISNNPVGLSLNTYVNSIHPNLSDYYVTDKADGDRAFLVLCPREKWPLTKAGIVTQAGIATQAETQAETPKGGCEDPSSDLAKLRLERKHLEDQAIANAKSGGYDKKVEDAIVAKSQAIMRLEDALDEANGPHNTSDGDNIIHDESDDLSYLSEDEEPVFGAGKKNAARESPYLSFLVTSTVKPVEVIKPNKIKSLSGVSIIDLEHIDGSMYAFDMLMHNDKDVTNENMEERLKALKEIAEALKIEVKTQIRLDTNPVEKIKKLIPGTNGRSKIEKYHVDGLIFTRNEADYWKSDAVYKMKPPDRLTIDFLMMRAPIQMMNAAPYVPQPGYTMYLLFTGINQDKMRQFNISTADLPHYRELFQNFGGAGHIFPIHFTTPRYKLAYIYYHPDDKKKLVLKETEPKDELHRHVGEFIWIPKAEKLESSKKTEKLESSKKTEKKTEKLESSKKTEKKLAKPTKSGKGELTLLPGMVPWTLVKLRADKDANVEGGLAYGNSYTTALDTFNDILHPLTYADLLKPPPEAEVTVEVPEKSNKAEDGPYFAKSKDQDYQPTTNYNNFAKAQPLQQLAHSNMVVDLMCGKGQDLFKYIGYQVKSLICIDKDAKALDELRIRFRDRINEGYWYLYPPMPPRPGINLHVMEYDMSKDLPGLSKQLTEQHMLGIGLADAVVCNLGLHYIIGSEDDMKSLIKFLNATLHSGGKFIFTSFNGNRIFQLLSGLKKGDQWTSEKGKYSIRRDYTEKVLGYGLKISVLHPFSNGELYEENLLPISMMVDTLAKAGYAMIQQGSFQDFWGRYEQLGKGLAARLSAEDRFYSSFYQYNTFVRLPTME